MSRIPEQLSFDILLWFVDYLIDEYGVNIIVTDFRLERTSLEPSITIHGAIEDTCDFNKLSGKNLTDEGYKRFKVFKDMEFSEPFFMHTVFFTIHTRRQCYSNSLSIGILDRILSCEEPKY